MADGPFTGAMWLKLPERRQQPYSSGIQSSNIALLTAQQVSPFASTNWIKLPERYRESGTRIASLAGTYYNFSLYQAPSVAPFHGASWIKLPARDPREIIARLQSAWQSPALYSLVPETPTLGANWIKLPIRPSFTAALLAQPDPNLAILFAPAPPEPDLPTPSYVFDNPVLRLRSPAYEYQQFNFPEFIPPEPPPPPSPVIPPVHGDGGAFLPMSAPGTNLPKYHYFYSAHIWGTTNQTQESRAKGVVEELITEEEIIAILIKKGLI